MIGQGAAGIVGRVDQGGGQEIAVERLLEPATILSARSAIASLYMDQKVVDYIVDLVRATRDPSLVGLTDLKPLIAFGGSPRASIALAQAAPSHRAHLRGRGGRRDHR